MREDPVRDGGAVALTGGRSMPDDHGYQVRRLPQPGDGVVIATLPFHIHE